MTTKHTPGPWATETGVFPAEKVWDSTGETIIADFIRAPRHASGNHSYRLAEGNANARLIAAAPDLLEALEESNAALHAVLNGPLSIDHDGNRTPARLAMRDSVWNALQVNKAALAKARGEA